MRGSRLALALGCTAFAGGYAIGRLLCAYDFRHQNVVIAGGSRGLGLVIARQLAREEARVILLARDPAELQAAVKQLHDHGAVARTYVCDVSNRPQSRVHIPRYRKRLSSGGCAHKQRRRHPKRRVLQPERSGLQAGNGNALLWSSIHNMVGTTVDDRNTTADSKYKLHWRQNRLTSFIAVLRQQICIEGIFPGTGSGTTQKRN